MSIPLLHCNETEPTGQFHPTEKDRLASVGSVNHDSSSRVPDAGSPAPGGQFIPGGRAAPGVARRDLFCSGPTDAARPRKGRASVGADLLSQKTPLGFLLLYYVPKMSRVRVRNVTRSSSKKNA